MVLGTKDCAVATNAQHSNGGTESIAKLGSFMIAKVIKNFGIAGGKDGRRGRIMMRCYAERVFKQNGRLGISEAAAG
jgi:hypothetical protein